MKSFYDMMKLMEADELGLGDQASQTQSQDQAPQDQAPQDQAPESQDQGVEQDPTQEEQPSEAEKPNNYMFFSNLKVIKSAVEEMLSMDASQIDALLDDGHDWASDHIATSKDDVEEVNQWLKSNMEGM
jgi:hypothetical protein